MGSAIALVGKLGGTVAESQSSSLVGLAEQPSVFASGSARRQEACPTSLAVGWGGQLHGLQPLPFPAEKHR